ncbi:MAG: AbrB/MazE/SpoVT family DNA-binding domain-containing protein [Candidatus Dormibacteria bacterium]
MKFRSHITRGGQVSIPAAVRRRWATENVEVEDSGDALIIRPLPADPVSAAIGSLPLPVGLTADGMRAASRLEEETAARHDPW